MADPLILTLWLDDKSFAWLDNLRQRHFPDRGYRLPAHLTLFHKLPGDRLERIEADLSSLCAQTEPFEMQVAEVLDFSPGAAFRFDSARLKELRATLADHWAEDLSAQDKGFRPHVTVQNKVPAEESVYDTLAQGFTPFTATAEGLLLWHYRGGPWEAAGRYRFGGIE